MRKWKRLKSVRIGQRVYWHDPDEESCSGPGTVVDLQYTPVDEDTIIHVDKDDGGYVECLVHELEDKEGKTRRTEHGTRNV